MALNQFLEHPIYVVTVRDQYLTTKTAMEVNAVVAFGREADARRLAAISADANDEPVSLYRIVEYACTGNVKEA